MHASPTETTTQNQSNVHVGEIHVGLASASSKPLMNGDGFVDKDSSLASYS
jgi:hypothetical protein